MSDTPKVAEMKFDILHRTRYTYVSPARDSFNDVP
jgi:hypothetical protein